MKVIIDIPEETYKGIMLGKWDDNGLAFYVKTGTPLDSAKAEIKKKCDRISDIVSVLSYPQHREIQELLCEILESIGKESEGTNV